jgi:hypothetical protein
VENSLPFLVIMSGGKIVFRGGKILICGEKILFFTSIAPHLPSHRHDLTLSLSTH